LGYDAVYSKIGANVSEERAASIFRVGYHGTLTDIALTTVMFQKESELCNATRNERIFKQLRAVRSSGHPMT
jgi:hypothetical protein